MALLLGKNFLIVTLILFLSHQVHMSCQEEGEEESKILEQKVEVLDKKIDSYKLEVRNEIGAVVEGLKQQLAFLERRIQGLPKLETQFIESPVFEDKKIFLHPKLLSRKKGNWFQNYDTCASAGDNSTEMATIHSKEENDFVHKWLRSNEVGMKHPGAWLGAQIFNKEKEFSWTGGRVKNYTNLAPFEFNEDGITCLTIGWDDAQVWWYNWWCIDARLIVLCQKYIYKK